MGIIEAAKSKLFTFIAIATAAVAVMWYKE